MGISSVRNNVVFTHETPSALGEALRAPGFLLPLSSLCLPSRPIHLELGDWKVQRRYVWDLLSSLRPKRVPLLVPTSSLGT